MRNYRTKYSLCGIPVSHRVYQKFGKFIPEFLRGVRSI